MSLVLLLCLNACFLANAQVEDAVIYGSVINAQDGDSGIYSFTTKEAKLTPVKMATELKAQGGGVYAQGKYYSVHADTRTLHIYDTDTWELLESKPMANLTLDMTFDPTTKEIYGCFIDKGAVLGKLNPSDGTENK
ncbi:hypothetical protein [Prevotella sp. OH937_COT-195]|uniref:hypothetical protein n=1 Tax=Prevotella sp. OH937_COT-195 TaxID=2491051 RepID=UPI000F65035D|nr:hypothetical protein [Prevotella sp. OH937_COT-195]RRC99444.1 hypothetical protein EII32_07945 [Prevotella sp. OH937_COT-195]